MSEDRHSFRTVAFGGFHRQDVIAYIQAAAKSYNGQITKLKADLEAEMATRAAAEQRAAAVESLSSVSDLEAERMRTTLSENAVSLDRLTAEAREKNARLSALESEVSALRAEVARLAPDAEAYAVLRDRAGGIELEAHSRAKSVITEAEASAAAIRNECEGWMARVRSSYEQLRNSIEATVFHATNELERTHNALTHAVTAFREHDGSLTRIADEHTPADEPGPASTADPAQ